MVPWSASIVATAFCRMWLTHVVAELKRAPSRRDVSGSDSTRATRRSGPRNFDTERTSAQRLDDAGVMRRYGASEIAEKWSSSITRTSGNASRIAERLCDRPAVMLAPVGFCARGVQMTARAPARNAASSAPGTIPSASTRTAAVRKPLRRSVPILERKQGSSTATRSPLVR